jgi:hypothetical protein
MRPTWDDMRDGDGQDPYSAEYGVPDRSQFTTRGRKYTEAAGLGHGDFAQERRRSSKEF